jgi:hypothetical protein
MVNSAPRQFYVYHFTNSLLDIIRVESQNKRVFSQKFLYTKYINQFAPNVLWKASRLFNLCKQFTFIIFNGHIKLIHHSFIQYSV